MGWKKHEERPKRFLLSCGRKDNRLKTFEAVQEYSARNGQPVQEAIWDILYERMVMEKIMIEDEL